MRVILKKVIGNLFDYNLIYCLQIFFKEAPQNAPATNAKRIAKTASAAKKTPAPTHVTSTKAKKSKNDSASRDGGGGRERGRGRGSGRGGKKMTII